MIFGVGTDICDVRRIRVRATEIRMFDRSTLIVPNSDLITKQVENKTLGDQSGRLKLQLTLNRAADAPAALKLIAAVLAEAPEVLDDPAPAALPSPDGRQFVTEFVSKDVLAAQLADIAAHGFTVASLYDSPIRYPTDMSPKTGLASSCAPRSWSTMISLADGQ